MLCVCSWWLHVVVSTGTFIGWCHFAVGKQIYFATIGSGDFAYDITNERSARPMGEDCGAAAIVRYRKPGSGDGSGLPVGPIAVKCLERARAGGGRWGGIRHQCLTASQVPAAACLHAAGGGSR